MPNHSDQEYFAGRALAERQLSATASDPKVAHIHAQLANHYECLVAEGHRSRPRLTITARG